MTVPFQFPIAQLPDGVTNSDEEWATYVMPLLGHSLAAGNKGGVWRDYLNELIVTESAVPAKSVKVDTGFALINGRGLWISAAETLTISDNASGNPRIDRVVAAYVVADYPSPAQLKVVAGTPAGSPAAPSLTQNASEWQIPLFKVAVANGFTTITNANLTDEREWANEAPSASPTGALMMYAGATAPTGWLLCYGQAISRSTYARLFTAISTAYGTGDGSTTFNVPDLRGRLPLGKDNMGGSSADRVTATQADNLGQGSGAETHTLAASEIPAHTHDQHVINNSTLAKVGTGSGGANYEYGYTGSNGTVNVTTASNTGGGGAHNNMPPYQTVNYIIKT